MTSSADGPQSRSMDEIERLANAYARRRDALRETVDAAQAALDRVKRAHRASVAPPYRRRRQRPRRAAGRRRVIAGSVPAAAQEAA